MPDFWQFPTVSMGLSPLMAIYQARFNRYLEDRGLKKKPDDQKVWIFWATASWTNPNPWAPLPWLRVKSRQPDLCGQLQPAAPRRTGARQRQNHPGAGGGFRGAGWNVIKVIWGSDWDPLLAQEKGLLVKRMEEVPDGQYQLYSVVGGDFIRKDFFGKYPELERMVSRLFGRADVQAAPRRPRSREGLCRLQGRRGTTGRRP
jgi:pyruvate dehydrogenase E1 component